MEWWHFLLLILSIVALISIGYAYSVDKVPRTYKEECTQEDLDKVSDKPRFRPHVEKYAVCAECGNIYCIHCHESCPQCGSVHIKFKAKREK